MIALLVAAGCGGGKATQSNEVAAEVSSADPKTAEPTPEVEPEAKPEAKPAEPTVIDPSADAGFERGPKPASTPDPDAVWDGAEPLTHAGATASVAAHVIVPEDEDETISAFIRVRIEFDGVDVSRGLNHERVLGARYCDEWRASLQEFAKLDDGRWLIDAQLACRLGEDYFSAKNAHTVILVDPSAKSAAVLWTGVDTGSNAMGVCSSASVHEFEVEGDALVISKTEHTLLNAEAAKDLPSAAEGCEPEPERTTIVDRVALNP